MTNGMAKNHVVIAIPAYQWTVQIGTMRSVLTDLLTLVKRGDDVSVYDESGSADLSDARAVMVAQFLKGPGTHLVNVDADVCWEAGALVRLVDAPHDVVGGAYPYRVDPVSFPVRHLPDGPPPLDPETGLLEVAGVAGGFVRYTRSALERMVEAYRETAYESSRGPGLTLHGLFDQMHVDGRKFTEDYSFCERWRRIGGKVWLDPTIAMGHIGNKMFAGRLSDALKTSQEAA
jgi:hypothetical protein